MFLRGSPDHEDTTLSGSGTELHVGRKLTKYTLSSYLTENMYRGACEQILPVQRKRKNMSVTAERNYSV